MDGGTGAVSDRPRFAPAESASERVSGAGAARQRPLTSLLELEPRPSAVPCARLHCRSVLAEWRLSALAGDAEVIVSELMANAVNASQRLTGLNPVALCLKASRERLVIEVWDHSPEDPRPGTAGADAENGRGLLVVKALSTRWGHLRTRYGSKAVWAELAVS